MTFLAPFALVGTLLLILPIIVHLFKPRKMRETPFSSLRWLKVTHQRLSRRMQWHQWLLFLLRAGCILLLVLALAKPLIGNWGAEAPTNRFVIIDTSRSMGYQASDQPTPLERAVDLADEMLRASRPGDRTAVIVSGATPRLLAPLSVDASSSLAALRALKPGLADTQLSATLSLVRTLLPRADDRAVELVFMTDNLATRWEQGDVQKFMHDAGRPVRTKVIETNPAAARNAWIAGARLHQFGPDDDRWIRVEVGCTGGAQAPRSIALTGIAGVEAEIQSVTLEAGQVARVDFRIPARMNLEGQVAQLRLEPADALPSDDVYFLNLDVPHALRVLLVEREQSGPDGRSVGLYLRAAMDALSASTNQALQVATRTAPAVTASDWHNADVVLLAGAPSLSDAALEGLEARVRGGAGLALFMGPRIDSAFYNKKIHRPHQPMAGLLPMTFKGLQTDGKPGLLTNVRWTHPLFASLRDPILSDLTQCRFRAYVPFDGPVGGVDAILARFDDQTPAIMEHPFGAGRVLVFNTTVNDEWSDLPKRKCFVPLLDRMLSYLSAGGVRRRFVVGDSVDLPMPDLQAGATVGVVTPSGAKLAGRVLGEKVLHLDETTEAGVYRIEGAGKASTFVVNTSRDDSSLRAMDAQALAAWWAPASVEVLSAQAISQRVVEQASQWPLWPAFIVLAGLLLIAESIYVHRLCPRANPKAADAVVPQRGLMRPVRGDAAP